MIVRVCHEIHIQSKADAVAHELALHSGCGQHGLASASGHVAPEFSVEPFVDSKRTSLRAPAGRLRLGSDGSVEGESHPAPFDPAAAAPEAPGLAPPALAFCRAVNTPTRDASGYPSHIDTPPTDPGDVEASFEARPGGPRSGLTTWTGFRGRADAVPGPPMPPPWMRCRSDARRPGG